MISLWIVFALLTGCAVFSVLWPLSRQPAPIDRGDLDVAFYKAQAAEIERDVARGTIVAEEADLAKAEAGRRLMAAAARDDASPPVRGSLFAVRAVSLVVLAFVPILALGLYSRIGAPDLPDMPLEARLKSAPAQMDLATAIAKIERHLAEEPNDGRGYEVLAPTYLRTGRPEDAVRAYAKSIALLGATADRYAGLGEAQVYLGGGIVTADAKSSFEQAIALDPNAPRAEYYLGLAAQQDGDKARALDTWRRLVLTSPPNAPWLPTIRARIADLSGDAAPEVASPASVSQSASAGMGAPTGMAASQGMAAAIQAMPEEQRQTAIKGMVDRLADRLKTNGGDLEGWLRLVRAYRVLDDQGKAKDALAQARRSFASDAAANKRLDALAHELGLEG